MKLRSALICIIFSLPLTAMFATSSWAGCPGTWIEGRNCVCPDGSSATTSDLTNWHCPRSSRPSRAAPPPSTIPNDRSAKNARKANQDEANAEKKLAEAEKAEEETRKKLVALEKAEEAAEKVLSDANKKVAALQKKVDATDDPAKKIELLKEQLTIKKSMLPVVRGRDQMGRSISNYENKLNTAEQTTARARAGLAQARQARIAAVTNRAPSTGYQPSFATSQSTPSAPSTAPSVPSFTRQQAPAPAATASTSGPKPNYRSAPGASSTNPARSTGRSQTPGQVAHQAELLNKYGGSQEAQNEINAVAANADYASLAAAAYKVDNESKPKVAGWELIDTDRYESKVGSKFFGTNVASVYRNSTTGEVVVAFQGTNFKEVGDHVTNTLSPTLISRFGQADWARKVARKIAKDNPNVTFTGHSLGGRLARLARVETGNKAVVFDSGPLFGVETAKEGTFTNAAGGAAPLMSFRAPGDLVSIKSAVRDIEVKNFVHGNVVQAHYMDQLATAMQTVKNVFEKK